MYNIIIPHTSNLKPFILSGALIAMRYFSFRVKPARSTIAQSLQMPTENIAYLDLGKCRVAAVRVHVAHVGTGQDGSEGGTDEEAGDDADELDVHDERGLRRL